MGPLNLLVITKVDFSPLVLLQIITFCTLGRPTQFTRCLPKIYANSPKILGGVQKRRHQSGGIQMMIKLTYLEYVLWKNRFDKTSKGYIYVHKRYLLMFYRNDSFIIRTTLIKVMAKEEVAKNWWRILWMTPYCSENWWWIFKKLYGCTILISLLLFSKTTSKLLQCFSKTFMLNIIFLKVDVENQIKCIFTEFCPT